MADSASNIHANHFPASDEGQADPAAALLAWRHQVVHRLGTPPLDFDGPSSHLHAEVLRVHGLLLEHITKQQGGRVPDQDELTSERLACLIRDAESRAATGGRFLPLPALCDKFRLDSHERNILSIALARAVAPGTGALLATAQGGAGRDHLLVALAAGLVTGDVLFTPPPIDLLGPASRLVSNRLVRIVSLSGRQHEPSIDRALLASEAVVSFVCGNREVVEPLTGLAELVRDPVTLNELAAAEDVVRRLESLALSLDPYLQVQGSCLEPPNRGPVLIISGEPGTDTARAAEALAGSMRRPLLRVSCANLSGAQSPENLLDEVFAQAAILDAVVCLMEPEMILDRPGAVVARLISGSRTFPGVTVLATERLDRLASELSSAVVFHVRLGRPDATQRELMWETALPQSVEFEDTPRLSDLAIRYELSRSQVENAVTWAGLNAMRRHPGKFIMSMDDLEGGAKEQMESHFDDLTTYRPHRRGLDAIVLPEETERAVRELVDACIHRPGVMNEWGFGVRLASGKGIVALFSGEPGTGKTLCAEIIASMLGLGVHAVAIPQIMSKWVGETEQNIARIFSRAKAQNTLLVFDEADALFTTRVKVESSMDRFSNMEVNQLLQEIDRFEGIVILTTNLETSIDQAFRRRIGFHITFPMPDAVIRERIWRTLLPPEAPVVGNLDFRELAQSYDLSGGHIKNVLVRAAYRARARGQAITMELLHDVAEDECKAAGKLFRRTPAGKKKDGFRGR